MTTQAGASSHPKESDLIRINVGNWGLTLVVDRDQVVRQLACGPNGHVGERSPDIPDTLYPEFYPTFGADDAFRSPALRITHANGNLTTRLVFKSVSNTPIDGGEHTIVICSDELYPVDVAFHFRTHVSSQMLEQWVEITNTHPTSKSPNASVAESNENTDDGTVIQVDSSNTIVVHEYASIAPFVLAADSAEVTQFGGSGWADEWHWTTQHLHPGNARFASLGGLQPHLQRSPMLLLSPNGPATEDNGDVIAMSVLWGGNTFFDLEVTPKPDLDRGDPRPCRIRAGANAEGADYRLSPGETLVTPTVAWTWSSTGRAGTTHSFHEWTRSRIMRDAERLRPIVVNNWEATFFDFNEQRITDLIERAADLGGDVFLLDDGWFGNKYPRDDDTTSLGDWEVDRKKLPNGVAPLGEAAAASGIRFGIWIEPEMVNEKSELYEAHPDWVLRTERTPKEHRNQLVLDPLIPQVADFAVDVAHRTIAQSPHISFVKWDANRPITDPGSSALPADRQSNVWVDHVYATWDIMKRVAQGQPEVELMLCASGGGRTDHGTLRYFHEFWTSDNTDPVTRVRMQWACTHFFPPSVMAAHVTHWGQRPIEFACAVALSGRFGIDLDLAALSDHEVSVLERAVALARRTQKVVQQGRLVRLVSPVGDGAVGEGVQGEIAVGDRSRGAVASISNDGSSAVLFAYQLEDAHDAESAADAATNFLLALPQLDPDSIYTVTTTDLTGEPVEVGQYRGGMGSDSFSIAWPLHEACTAQIWEFTRTG